METYRLFIIKGDPLPKEHESVQVEVMNIDTMETMEVKATLSSAPPEENSDWHKLWIREKDAYIDITTEPWSIKIEEDLEDKFDEMDEVVVKKQTISLGKRKGAIISSLIHERKKDDSSST